MELLIEHISKHIDLPDEKIALIKKYFLVKTFKKKEYLLESGMISRNEFFVIKGCLRTFVVDNNGIEHNIMFATEGWWTGDFSSFKKEERAFYDIQAIEESKVLLISKKNWDKLLREIPEFVQYTNILFHNAVIAQQSRIVQTLSFSAEERFLDFISKHPGLVQRVPQKQIASYLGITPEFLSMLRNKLAKK